MRADEERDATSRDHWSEALTWYVALRDASRRDLTYVPGRKWQEWYADPANRRVFEDLSRLLADHDRYRKRDLPRKSELEEDLYDLSLPIAEWRRNQAQKERPHRRRRPAGRWWWLSGGLGVAAMAVLLALSPLGFGPEGSAAGAAIYETHIGGIKDVRLLDGSSVILGGRTKLSVTFSPRRRSVRLMEGEAWFRVAHDPNWPFVVAAGGGTITAVGTAFLVTRESDRVVVTVTDGTVEISTRPPVWHALRFIQRITMRSVPPSVPVSRGEQVAFSEGGALHPVKAADAEAAVAWTRGHLTFDAQPLRYVVETVNRYFSRQIVVDPSVAELRFSGIIFESDIEGWLKSLQVIFPVTESERGNFIYIRTRSSTSTSLTELPKKPR